MNALWPDETFPPRRLRRIERLVRVCIPAVVGLAVLGVVLSTLTILRYGDAAAGGVEVSVALAVVFMVGAAYVHLARKLRQHVRSLRA